MLYCQRCVMDGSAEEIVVDETGCNFCHNADRELALSEALKPHLAEVVNEIKDSGKEYDCLIGLSGGVDSSYLLHLAVSLGLKPICYSVDNGWNSEISDENILKLVETLQVPFYRYVIDKQKFVELQGAFMKAGQKNLEIPTDHILMATTYEMAKLYGVKYILSGGNAATESIMPASWGYNARDLVHIKDVYRRMTGFELTGLPTCSLLQWNIYRWWYGMKTVYLLDYVDYNKEEAKKILKEKYGWEEYGAKHEESIFTSWFQSFYLFQKFGIDKRKAHLSSLICSGQLTRSQALEELALSPVYPEIGLEKRAMSFRKRPHTDFKTDDWLYRLIASFVRLWR